MKIVKAKIIGILEKHPEGLTAVDVSNNLKISRNTASKYICQLLIEKAIYQREVGNAKLCYLKAKK